MTAVASTRLDLERTTALRAVVAASRLTRAVRSTFGPADAVAKADRTPVTVADLGAQALVRMALADRLPADGLMGEEDSRPLSASPELAQAVLERVRDERPGVDLDSVHEALDSCDDPGGPGRRWWTLDPIDGTKGFLRNEQYAVALALVEDGEVVLAVMGCPNLPLGGEPAVTPVDGTDAGASVGCLFVAERGVGTRMLALADADAGAAGTPVRVAHPASASEARYAESVESGHSNQSEAARIAELLGISAEPLRLDSQTKYAVVARGDASIYLRLPHGGYKENVWDHATGYLIVSEAGGLVSDVEGKPLDFTTGTRLMANRGVVAAAAAIHDEVLGAVRSVLG